MAVYNPNTYNKFTWFRQQLVIWFILLPFYNIFFRLKVKGRENIPKDGKPFIIMPNHISNLDPPLISLVFNIPIAYMAKKELYEMPFWGWAITMLGAFSVDREKVEKTTIKAVKEILIKKRWCIGLFLEGTRSKISGVLGNPNSGPAYFSKVTKVPILPVGIIGSNKLFGPLTVNIGEIFYPDEDIEKARWQCAEKLAELTSFKLPK